MPLTRTLTGSNPIVVTFSTASTSGTIRYTVPTGRTWRGHMWGFGGTSPNALINGVTTQLVLNSTGSSSFPVPVTLPSGTIVADGGTSGIGFIGIEE
jgi:hypothetical protein